jgi:transcriptional regulator with XRE-family HTH domain
VDGFEEVGLSKLVRQLREAQGWTPTQMAIHVGCAQSHIWQIENEKSRGPRGWVPSEEFLRKLSVVCTTSPEGEVLLRQRLLLLRAREVVPVEVRGYLSSSVLLPMPEVFLIRLQKDLGRGAAAVVARVDGSCRLEGRLRFVLQGFGQLTAFEVVLVANAVKQSVDQYLLAAGYLSDGMKMLLQEYEGCVNLLEVVAGISPTTRRELEDFRTRMVTMGQKKQSVR